MLSIFYFKLELEFGLIACDINENFSDYMFAFIKH